MKRFIYILLIILLAFFMAACNGNPNSEQIDETKQEETVDPDSKPADETKPEETTDPSTVEKIATDELISTLASIRTSLRTNSTISEQELTISYYDSDGNLLTISNGNNTNFKIMENGTYLKVNDNLTYDSTNKTWLLNGKTANNEIIAEFNSLQRRSTNYTTSSETKYAYDNLSITATSYSTMTSTPNSATVNASEQLTVENGANIYGITSLTLSYQAVVVDSKTTYSNIKLVIQGTETVAGTYRLTSEQLQTIVA